MRRITSEVFAIVIDKFLSSEKFHGLADETRRSYRRCLKLAGHPDILGSVPVDVIRPSLVQAFLDGLADRPGTQERARIALKVLERWAIVRDLLPRSITMGTEIVGPDGGHIPWTDEQVAFAEKTTSDHVSRAITLGANTGQRGSDLVKMRWTDIETIGGRTGINVKQQKTGVELWIPFTPELAARMESWERRPGFILLGISGRPFRTRGDLNHAWRRERQRPEIAHLRHLHLHGLRGTAVVRLQRRGASIREITSLVGLSQKMVERYCRLSVQKENALAAVERLDSQESAANILKFHK